MVFGRALRDYIPAMPYKYAPLADWCLSQELRERLLANFREKDGEKLARHTKQLEELPVGTPVVIQNQYPTKWDNMGVILKIKPHSELVIKLDGSRRMRMRMRMRRLYPEKWSVEDHCQPQVGQTANSLRPSPPPAAKPSRRPQPPAATPLPPPTQPPPSPTATQPPQRLDPGYGVADIEELNTTTGPVNDQVEAGAAFL